MSQAQNIYALLSVYDKTNLEVLAKSFIENGIKIIATDSTAGYLAKHNIDSITVEDYTGFAQILGGRVKTLNPKIFAGILANRAVENDLQTLKQLNISQISFVVVNLYPFASVVAKEDCTLDMAVENIDIGGVSLIRAAAKNFKTVTVATDPSDYDAIAKSLSAGNDANVSKLKASLAQKAFLHTANYDAKIHSYLTSSQTTTASDFPQTFDIGYIQHSQFSYGENPHQKAYLYSQVGKNSWYKIISSTKTPSYNNLVDVYSAAKAVSDFLSPTTVIVKHANPCAVATADDVASAYTKAYNCDSESAFGGISAINTKLNDECVTSILQHKFLQILIVPNFCVKALQRLTLAKPNLMILQVDFQSLASGMHYKFLPNMLLMQSADILGDSNNFKLVSKKSATANQFTDLLFAWQVVKNIKSNAIVLAKDLATYGLGIGQVSRVFALNCAITRAKQNNFSTKSAVLASDGFLPFTDNVELAHKAGITAIIQPGGSKSDEEVIKMVDDLGMVMFFTNRRHFSH